MITRPGALPQRQANNIDFLSLIAQLNSDIRRPLSITWVKSHQDSNATTKAGPLSRDAINNIAVDELASQHRILKHLSPRQKTPHLRHTKITISINGLRLPGHFDSMLRFHINGYHLRIHMQDRFQWTDSTWNLIDHYLFGQHFRSLTPAQQIPRMKFVHNQQPLGHRLSKYQTSTASLSDVTDAQEIETCPCCQTSCETQRHFLQCSSNPNHSTAIRDFQKALHSRELDAVFYLISFGVLHWIAGEPLSTLDWDLRGYPKHMHSDISAALEDQAAIGWLSCIKGFFSTCWTTVARLSMHSPTIEMDAGSARLRHIINSLHLFTTLLWKGRNDSLHRQDETRLRSSNRQEDLEITHFYNRPELLSTSDQHYCARPLSQILSFTPANRRRWLHLVKLACSRRLTNQQSQCRISQFFTRTDTIPVSSVDPTTVPSYEPPPLPAPPPRQESITNLFHPAQPE